LRQAEKPLFALSNVGGDGVTAAMTNTETENLVAVWRHRPRLACLCRQHHAKMPPLPPPGAQDRATAATA